MTTLMLLLSGTFVPSAATIAAAPEVTVEPVSSEAVPDGTLMYKIHIDNDTTGNADLGRFDVTLRYDPNTLTLIDSKLNDSSDWVSNIGNGKATVQFGAIDADDARSATLIFHINPAVAVGAPILVDARYEWWAAGAATADAATGSGYLAVDDMRAVSAVSIPSSGIAPASGFAGTTFQVGVDGFAGAEDVVTCLNTPWGVRGLDLIGTANPDGTLELQLNSAGLAPGDYSLVVHGLDSGHEDVLSFSVSAA